VTLEEPGTFPASSPFAANDTIQISSGSVTAGSAGNLTITDSDLTADTALTSINVTGTTAEVNPTDKPQFDITGDVDAITVGTGVAVGDSATDFSYTSTGTYTLTLRQVTSNAELGVVTPGGTVLGNGTSDGTGTATLTLTRTR